MHGLFDALSGFVPWLEQTYDIRFERLRPDIPVHGSPERSLSRTVLEDAGGGLYLLEQFGVTRYREKHRIAQILDNLRANGLDTVIPCISTIRGTHLPRFDGQLYQLSRFVASTPLQRPGYLSNAKMGENLARFLICLAQASEKMSVPPDMFPVFSIKRYIKRLAKEMADNDPSVFRRYRPFISHLFEMFMPVHDQLPLSFVHGDYHVKNVIWENDGIAAVIDWEFCGIKPKIYDAANLVGCAGIEDPEGIGMPLVTAFMACLAHTDLFAGPGGRWFADYVLALRFAWLSEWLRRKDEQMLDLEARYMKILMDHQADLTAIWFRRQGRSRRTGPPLTHNDTAE